MRESIITLAVVLAVLGMGWGVALQAQSSGDVQNPRELVDKCITALGGEGAVKNFRNFKGDGDLIRYYSGTREMPGTITMIHQGEKYWRSMTLQFRDSEYTTQYIYNGKRAWSQRNGEPTSQPVLSFTSDRDHTPLLLLEKDAQLQMGQETESDGKKTWVVMLTFKGKSTAFYIDQTNYTLMEIRFKDLYFNKDEVKATIEKRLRFSDYRKMGGMMFPFSMTYTKDGKKSMTTKFKTVVFNPVLSPDLFVRPSKKPDLRYSEERLN